MNIKLLTVLAVCCTIALLSITCMYAYVIFIVFSDPFIG